MESQLDRFFDPYIQYLNDIVQYCEYTQQKQLKKSKTVEISQQWLKVYQSFKTIQLPEFDQIISIFAQASDGCILFKADQYLVVNYIQLKPKCIQSFLEFQANYKQGITNIDYDDVQITKKYFLARFYSSNTRKVYKYQNSINQPIKIMYTDDKKDINYLFKQGKPDSNITLDASLSIQLQQKNESSIKEFEEAKQVIKQQTFDKKVKLLEELISANYFGQQKIPYTDIEKKFMLFYGELSMDIIKKLDLIELKDKFVYVNWLKVARNAGRLISSQK